MRLSCLGAAWLLIALPLACGTGTDAENDDDGSFFAAGGAGSVASTGGSPPMNGTWGNAEPVLEVTDYASSLAITENETVLYYFSETRGAVMVTRRTDTSEGFPSGLPVLELTDVCSGAQAATVDVTHDGLNMYIVCVDGLDCASTTCTVIHATRSSTTQPFVVQGQVATGIGSSPSITADQLQIHTSARDPDAGGEALFVERSSTSAAFGPAQVVPGTAWPETVIAPELSADRRELYFNARTSMGIRLFVATRTETSQPFGQPTELPFGVGASQVGSADLSADGRALYFVTYDDGPLSTIHVTRR